MEKFFFFFPFYLFIFFRSENNFFYEVAWEYSIAYSKRKEEWRICCHGPSMETSIVERLSLFPLGPSTLLPTPITQTDSNHPWKCPGRSHHIRDAPLPPLLSFTTFPPSGERLRLPFCLIVSSMTSVTITSSHSGQTKGTLTWSLWNMVHIFG